jgi:thiosulfate/3-mercaptopyruvate sulfurtransferase
MHAYGFSHVRMLDGGLWQYMKEGYPVEEGKDYKGKKTIITDLSNPEKYLANIDEIKRFADGKLKDVQLIDARPREEFLGNTDDDYPKGTKGGSIPGAISITKSDFLHEDSETFLTATEMMSKIVVKHDLDPDKRTICMCYAGISATVPYIAFHKLGFKNLQVYDGSWSEYGSKI